MCVEARSSAAPISGRDAVCDLYIQIRCASIAALELEQGLGTERVEGVYCWKPARALERW